MTYGENSPYRDIPWSDAFSSADLFDIPRALRDGGGERKYVCVVGAGLAGLAAAYELHKLGHRVLVLEAADRPGGRVYTYRFTDEAYGELGAMRIPADHKLVLNYANHFGLDIRPFVHRNWQAYLYFGKLRCRRAQWSDILTHVRNRINSTASTTLQVPPWQVMEEIAKNAYGPMSAAIRWAMFSSSPDTLPNQRDRDLLRKYESETLWQYITANGRGSAAARKVGGGSRSIIHLTEPEWEIIGRLTLDLPFERAAFTQWLINEIALQNPKKYEIAGGMSRLIDEFVKGITEDEKGVIRLKSPVAEISYKGGVGRKKVRVTWQNVAPDPPAPGNDDFDYVICAAPAPATARINFPQMTQEKFEALTNLTYLPSAKALIFCDKRHWELAPDGIMGGGTYTDLGTQQSWYPSDNAVETFENGSYEPAGFTEGGGSDEVSGSWRAIDEGRSHEPSAFLAAYMYGPTAQHFSSLSTQERRDYVVDNVSEYHPWLRGRGVVKDFRAYSWDDHSSPGGGAYAFFSPGEFSRYQELLEQPIPLEDPRIFFAGEHIAVAHAWMQSALQSGLSAAQRIAENP
ncbi:flavin monoamine oxidase family protein [Streptomyces sp. NPDC002402]